MKDENKTKKQLIEELTALRRRSTELEAEKSQRESNKDESLLFRTIVESSSEAIAISDPDGRFVYVNPAHEKLFKRPYEEALKLNFRDYYPDESVKIIDGELGPAREMGESWEGVLEVFDANGRKFPLWERADAVRDKEDNILYGFGIMHDISEQKKAEEVLRQRTHELGERVKELNCLYGISSLLEKADISSEELLALTVELIPPSWQFPEITCARIVMGAKEFKTKDFRITAWKQYCDITVHGENIGVVEVYYTEEKPDSDEGPFLKEERSLINVIAERLGKIIEYKQARDMLQTERDKFRGVLNALGEGMYIVNRDFLIEYQNEIMEVIFPGGTGKKCYNTYTGANKPCDYCLINASISSFKVRQIETIRSKGRSYDLVFSPFQDVDGNAKVIVLLRDITEKKMLEGEAMQAGHLAALGELAAGVAHEINNPINGIINYAEMLKDKCNEQGQDDEIPERIIREGERVAQIVRNLLSFARDRDEEQKSVHVRDILQDALGLMENQLVKDHIRCRYDLEYDVPMIYARGQEIQQVFLNILSNARYALNSKFPRPHKDKILEIRVRSISLKGRKYVRTVFYDRGIGIPAKILVRICNPFFSTKPKGEGTGLGLSISHGIVKNHDGRLSFNSVEGEYTKVMVDLPCEYENNSR